jgi:hypothetical protein
MSALLFLKNKREVSERMDFVSAMRTALANSEGYKKAMEQWARSAEIELRFDD